MKKLILNVVMVFVTVFQMSAQIDEKKLTLSEAQLSTSAASRTTAGNVDCQCGNNIVADGGFGSLTNNTGSSNISAASNPWKPNTYTPQWTPAAAACDNGFISMWGNQAVFESVKQTASIPTAGTYKIKFTARFANLNPPNSINVSLKVTIGTATVVSAPISSTSWGTYTMTITGVPAGSQLVILQPTNSHNVNDGNYVSWIQLDKICIEKACDCSQLPNQFAISGPSFFCQPKNCNTTLTYTAPKLDPNCYKYTWDVSPTVPFTGQGTHQINLACKDLKPGTYKITVRITCDGKTVTSTMVLVVCAKPDPTFSVATSGSGVSLNPLGAASGHLWYLVQDNDNSCGYTGGDVILAPSPITTPTASFTGLVNNKQYAVYHIAYNDCGNNFRCYSIQIMCFRFLPPMRVGAPNAEPQVQKVSEQVVDNIKALPQDLRSKIPTELRQLLENAGATSNN